MRLFDMKPPTNLFCRSHNKLRLSRHTVSLGPSRYLSDPLVVEGDLMLKVKEQLGSRPSYTLWEPDFVGSREAFGPISDKHAQSSGARIIRFRAVPRKPRSPPTSGKHN